MKPFSSVSEAIEWWKQNVATIKGTVIVTGRECCMLVDNTDIGQGIQRRIATKYPYGTEKAGTWTMGIIAYSGPISGLRRMEV